MPPDPTTSSSPEKPGDRTQDKADILENNLFSQISKQGNPFVCHFHINRETAPDPVVIRALIQLMPRIGIKNPQVLILLRKLMMEPSPQGKEVKIQNTLFSLANQGNPDTAHLEVILRAAATARQLAVEIKGVTPVQPRDGAIGQAFFDHERCPGIIHSDGTIDFKEINKYPIVKAGDNLFFITPEVQGRSGIQYDGTLVPVPRALPLAIALRGGVDMVDSMTQEGRIRGSFIRAAQTGVVLIDRSNGRISEVEVRDALDVKRLDYSTGNIGTEFICPISMKIDTICNGFRIRAKGTLEVGSLEGGHVQTESSATVHSAHPGSTVRAEKDIVVHFSKGARFSSMNGFGTITDEMVDSHMDARGVVFDKYKGIMASTTLDAEQITLKNIFLCGDNTIHFGRRLFEEKEKLMQARAKLKEAMTARKEEETRITTGLHDTIKALSRILKGNPLLRDNLIAFILAAQSMDYSKLYQELDTMAQTMNIKEIDQIRKSLDALKQIPDKRKADEEMDGAMIRRIAQAEADMPRMHLTIEALLRRAATLRIFTPEDSEPPTEASEPPREPSERPQDPKPRLFVESEKDKDTLIRITGAYNRPQGFVITRI